MNFTEVKSLEQLLQEKYWCEDLIRIEDAKKAVAEWLRQVSFLAEWQVDMLVKEINKK